MKNKTRILYFVMILFIGILIGCSVDNNNSGNSVSNNKPSNESSSNLPEVKYTVTWENWDGTILEIDKGVEYGTIPSYEGSTPSRVGDSQYTYIFIGWDKEISHVKGNIVFIAKYEAIERSLEMELSSDGTYYIVKGIGTCIETNIIIPSIYENLPVKEIGEKAFYNYSELTNIIIPDSVTSIGRWAFYDCINLKSVTIGNSVTNIGYYTFGKCSSLISAVIPNSVTSINTYAFDGCNSFTNVYYKGTIKDWCNISFNDSESNPMYYAEHFYMLDENKEWYEVTNIEIPSTVTSIGQYQFYDFENIASIVIQNSVTRIGSYAFSNCSNLTSIVISNSVTVISGYAFSYCDSLTIYCEAKSRPTGCDSSWDYFYIPVVWGYEI